MCGPGQGWLGICEQRQRRKKERRCSYFGDVDGVHGSDDDEDEEDDE